MATRYVIDTSVLLTGHDPPPGQWYTTPEAAHEVSPGGKDARRFAYWKEAGLEIRGSRPDSEDRVDDAAMSAGSLGRLSLADRSIIALAHELQAVLISDDHTVLDVARRLGLMTKSLHTEGIQDTLDWRPRCSGCGRWFDEPQKRDECPVCGSPVKDKPWKPS